MKDIQRPSGVIKLYNTFFIKSSFLKDNISISRKTLTAYILSSMTINPWINFNGNAEEAFMFYQSVLGGEIVDVVRFKEITQSNFHLKEEEKEKLMQITLNIGGAMITGNDVPSFLGTVSEQENRSKIRILTESKEEAEKVFNGLSAGGNVEGPLEEGPGRTYFGTFRDKYGIEWIVEYKPSV